MACVNEQSMKQAMMIISHKIKPESVDTTIYSTFWTETSSFTNVNEIGPWW